MRTGCIVTAIVLVILIGVAGYIGYRMMGDSLDIPEDLKAYTDRETMMAEIRSTRPAPPDTTHLTAGQVEVFVGALDSLATGWNKLAYTLDSVRTADSGAGSLSLWTTPALLKQIIQLPLVTRRAIVSYLNDHDLSWAEYIWLKERTIAASGITPNETDSALSAILQQHLDSDEQDAFKTDKMEETALFTRVAKLRASGVIDSSDVALVAPYRRTILDRGIPTLIGIETEEEDADGGLTVGMEQKK